MTELIDHLQTETVGETLVVTVMDRELRSDLVEIVRPHVLRLLDGSHRRVLLDLQHVAFLESTALGLIIQLGSKLSKLGGRLVLCGARSDVARLFTGPPMFPFAIEMYPDRPAALEIWNGDGGR